MNALTGSVASFWSQANRNKKARNGTCQHCYSAQEVFAVFFLSALFWYTEQNGVVSQDMPRYPKFSLNKPEDVAFRSQVNHVVQHVWLTKSMDRTSTKDPTVRGADSVSEPCSIIPGIQTAGLPTTYYLMRYVCCILVYYVYRCV